jgi:small GTP-binding protein
MMSNNISIRTDLKILVIGCSGAGKTSFVQRWIKGEFQSVYSPTIVSEFQYKIFECRGNCYRIQLWDIGGQDKTPSMAKIFTRDSHGCIVVSDITRRETYEETMKWKKVVKDESAFIDGDKLPFIFIQNKIDLIKDNDEYLNLVTNETKKIAEDKDFLGYYMTSVKENINVEEPINFLIDSIVERLEKFSGERSYNFTDNNENGRDTYKLEKEGKKEKNKKDGGCC